MLLLTAVSACCTDSNLCNYVPLHQAGTSTLGKAHGLLEQQHRGMLVG